MDKRKQLNQEFIWVVTGECTRKGKLACPDCFNHSQEGELDAEQRRIVANNLIEINPPKVLFTGGEPTLINDLNTLSRHLHNNGIKNSLTTNGDLLTSQNFSEISPYITNVNMGVKSLTDPSMNLDKMARTMGMIRGQVPLYVNVTVSKQNKNDLEEVVQFLGDKVDKIKLVQFSPIRGMARQNRDRYEICDEEYGAICEQIIEKYPNLDIRQMSLKGLADLYLRIAPNGTFEVIKGNKEIIIGNPIKKFLKKEEIIEAVN